ncbi:MAG: transcription elongation factor Spt5 [Candidatus Aenigmarchaeota archaeon]|nr:transcription elongation factor Spt5 [Candidatus Aenigmarchaeota archaeon]
MIVTIRTTMGRENMVLEALSVKIDKRKSPIKSLFRTEDLRGYIFVEGDPDEVDGLIKNVQHVRGIVARDVSLEELEKFLVPEKQHIQLEIGDVVEIIGSPFKGEKAKITRVDEMKNDITVELLEVAIPIPVTIPAASVRLHKKKE